MFRDLGLLLSLQNVRNILRGVLYFAKLPVTNFIKNNTLPNVFFTLFDKTNGLVKLPPNKTFNCHNLIGIKSVARLRLGLTHLQDHKFKHNFLDCLNPICCCGSDIETTVHYLLHCPIFSEERSIFLNNIRSIDENVLSGSDSRISETLYLVFLLLMIQKMHLF